jgi:uncharacterized protein YecE (DUF72 family)
MASSGLVRIGISGWKYERWRRGRTRLRGYGLLAAADGCHGRFSCIADCTAQKKLYVSGYDDDALDDWAARVAAWARGNEPADAERVIPHPAPKRLSREVFVYFDNDAKVRAPFDAEGLTTRVAKLLGDKGISGSRGK